MFVCEKRDLERERERERERKRKRKRKREREKENLLSPYIPQKGNDHTHTHSPSLSLNVSFFDSRTVVVRISSLTALFLSLSLSQGLSVCLSVRGRSSTSYVCFHNILHSKNQKKIIKDRIFGFNLIEF